MEGIRRWRPSPALVISFIALFVAGAGTATAARLITGRSIKNNSVTGRDIRNSSLGSRDVKNGSLLRRDFRRGQLQTGAQGPAGRNGVNGFGVLRYVSRDFTVAPGAAAAQGTTPCPAGTYPTGGDAYITNDQGAIIDDAIIESQFFTFDTANGNLPNGWRARTAANNAEGKVLVVDAICANASSRPGVTFQSRSRQAAPGLQSRGAAARSLPRAP
jgi:hypothetical protein